MCSTPSVKRFHQAVDEFKRSLIQATLDAHRGNRTHTARTLGLQRTYLLRLMRDYDIAFPKIDTRITNGE